jgi:hypothetical protein
MTLPQRPAGFPEAYAEVDERFGWLVVERFGHGLTEPEARYIVSLVNAAPAIEAELSALREARREEEEETTKLNRYLEDAAIWKIEAITREGELRALVRDAVRFIDEPESWVDDGEAWLEKARAAIGSADAGGQAGGGG